MEMNVQKGFSLIEVLLSLSLACCTLITLCFFQDKIHMALQHLLLSSKALVLLDEADEALLASDSIMQKPLNLFVLSYEQSAHSLNLSLSCYQRNLIWRRIYFI